MSRKRSRASTSSAPSSRAATGWCWSASRRRRPRLGGAGATAARTGIRTSSTAASRSSPNHYYFYIRDPDWGPSFIKTIAYAPFSIWIYLNGHEWAKQQAARQGIAFSALDNGFAACEDPASLADDLPPALGRGRVGVP